MKKNRITDKFLLCAALLGAVLSFSSCEKFLTKIPPDTMATDGFWGNASDVNTWLTGTYNGVTLAISANIQPWGDGRTDNVFSTTYGIGPNYQFNSITASEGRANWANLYTAINRCNMAIENVPKISSLSIGEKENYLGHFHGLRALLYFYIVRLWGDAPLITEPWNGNPDTKYNSRTPVEKVAELIEQDIEKAVTQLQPSTGVYFLNPGAALTLKADFLTWRGRYAEVLGVYEAFKKIGAYSLVTTKNDWKNIFTTPTASKETLFTLYWALPMSGSVNSETSSPYAGTLGFSGSNAPFSFGRAIFNLMVQDTMDVRFYGVLSYESLAHPRYDDSNGKSVRLPSATPDRAPEYAITATAGINRNIQAVYKYIPFGSGMDASNAYPAFPNLSMRDFKVPVYRLADMLLLYAEALNRTGDGQGALDIVNAIRKSRGSSIVFTLSEYNAQLGNTANSREKLIMDERQLEFFAEGKRWFDLIRMDWGIQVLDEYLKYLQTTTGIPVTGFTNPQRLLWPVAQSVLTANLNLKQNPGYSGDGGD